jgi:hypothetical protein
VTVDLGRDPRIVVSEGTLIIEENVTAPGGRRTDGMVRHCLAVIGFSLFACRPSGANGIAEARADQPSPSPVSSGVAVVELFTSEGCSSCPPADAVFAELTASNHSVYALAFHVDYWDDLGWRDRFASPDYTARQRSYARSFGTDSLFTPQMVVNGVESFTGNDRSHAAQAVASALVHPPEVRLSIRVRMEAVGAITVDYDAPHVSADALINVAVAEHASLTDVRAGENAGRLLHHMNVARAYVVASAKQVGSVRLQVPAALQNGEVIAYLQRRPDGAGGMRVLGATRAPLPH